MGSSFTSPRFVFIFELARNSVSFLFRKIADVFGIARWNGVLAVRSYGSSCESNSSFEVESVLCPLDFSANLTTL